MSFGLSQEPRTLEAIQGLKTDDDYWITSTRLRFSSGKSYRVIVMYLLKGHELLVAERHCDQSSLDSAIIVDLEKCSLMTELLLEELSPPIWSPHPRSRVCGERFFFAKGFYGRPSLPAFDLEFPKKRGFFQWKEAVKFSQKVKSRIYERLVERATDQP